MGDGITECRNHEVCEGWLDTQKERLSGLCEDCMRKRNEAEKSAEITRLRADLAASQAECERMRQDADRYVWLIAHMGLVEREAVKWNPAVNKPLLSCLQDFIDVELPKAGNGWVEKQRAALAEGAQG